MTYAAAEDGFSIIELLVAIAITSFVVLAIGGLLTLGLRVKERVDENSAVQSALIDLQGFAVLAASEVGFAVSAIGERGFKLLKPRASEAPIAWSVEIRDAEIELHRGRRKSTVKLSVFESAELEYLASSAGPAKWTSTKPGLSDALAVRLRLERDRRVWRPLIWISSPGVAAP